MANKYIDPIFSSYDKGLARAMTYWLYSDPAANPLFYDQSLWGWNKGPRVCFVGRTVEFGVNNAPLVSAGGSQTINLAQVFGGKNAVVFSQSASSRRFPAGGLGPPATVLPNTGNSNITINQSQSDLCFEIETQPLNNAFGTVPGQPYMFDIPRFWYGPDARDFTVTNNDGNDRIITISFLAAVLDNGR